MNNFITRPLSGSKSKWLLLLGALAMCIALALIILSDGAEAKEDKIATLQIQKTELLKTLETQKKDQAVAIDTLKTVENSLKATREAIKTIDNEINAHINKDIPAELQGENYFFQ